MDIRVHITCPFCGADHSVVVDFNEYSAWQSGELIQRAMPTASATEREQLISGMCPKCQDGIFGTEIEEDEIDVPDDVDECGYDPYAGCYTEDC